MIRRLLVPFALIVPLGCSGNADEPNECFSPTPLDTVRLEDFAFEPDCLLAASGEGIRLENVGEAPHTFTVSGTGIGFDVQAGETVKGNLTGINPGLYSVKCVYHPQMTATLRINR